MARFILFAAQRGRWADRRCSTPRGSELATSKAVETLSPVNDPDTPDWLRLRLPVPGAVPEHVVRADGAFWQYGVIFEEKDTILIFAERLRAAAGTSLPARGRRFAGDHGRGFAAGKPGGARAAPPARAGGDPADASMRNRAAEMQAGGKRLCRKRRCRALRSHRRHLIVAPQGGKNAGPAPRFFG